MPDVLTLKIVLLTHSVNPRGGVVHTLELGRVLHAQGHQVTIFAPAAPGQNFFRATPCNVSFAPIIHTPKNVVDMVSSRINACVSHLRNTLARESFDIFHAQDSISGNALADLCEEGVIEHFARTAHHLDQFDDQQLMAWQERAFRSANKVLCVSELWAQKLAWEQRVVADRVFNGVDTERFSCAPVTEKSAISKPTFLAVGGVEERKNTLRILEAFVLVRERVPNARLLIACGTSLLDHDAYAARFRDTLNKHGLTCGIDEPVHLTRAVAYDAMRQLFRSAAALVTPSLKEGFGLVVLEALACGTPVVASNIAPFTEYLSDELCHWADPQQASSIAAAMQRAASGVRGTTLRTLADPLLTRMSWAASAEQHINIYQTLLQHYEANAAQEELARA